MFELIAIILVLLWLLRYFAKYTLGGLFHLLLVIGVVAIVTRVIKGRRL